MLLSYAYLQQQPNVPRYSLPPAVCIQDTSAPSSVAMSSVTVSLSKNVKRRHCTCLIIQLELVAPGLHPDSALCRTQKSTPPTQRAEGCLAVLGHKNKNRQRRSVTPQANPSTSGARQNCTYPSILRWPCPRMGCDHRLLF